MLALAQHYSLPTRLLDWTENPLVALWFAFNEIARQETKRVVWCFGVKKENISRQNEPPFDITRTRVFNPKHITINLPHLIRIRIDINYLNSALVKNQKDLDKKY
jgi:hypothetical protein